jgi:acetate kinase
MSDLTRLQHMTSGTGAILVINCGSSSVKFALFDGGQLPLRYWSGSVDRIGIANTRFHIADAQGRTVMDQADPIADHEAALAQVLDIIDRHASELRLAAVGHRVVHGGAECDCPIIVTRAVEARLRQLVPLAPLHQPHNLAGIAAVRKARPDLSQVACFDTAFHHGLPRDPHSLAKKVL